MTEEELAHYGVMGMKWGRTRAKATGTEIRSARRKVEGMRTAHTIALDQRRRAPKGSADRARLDKTVNRIETDFKKMPERVVAARMTRGEKAAALIIAGPFGLIPIAGSSVISRTIEQRQDKGAHNKKK